MGGELAPSAFPAGQARGPGKVLLQGSTCWCLQHVMARRVPRGAKSICLQQGLGAGYAGEEWGGGEDHVVGQILFLLFGMVSLRVCHEPRIMNYPILCMQGPIGKKKNPQVKDLI